MGAFGGVIAIERIFGALKQKFVKNGGYGCMDCQVSNIGVQILGGVLLGMEEIILFLFYFILI